MRYRSIIVAFLAVCLGLLTSCSQGAQALDRNNITYDEILGTGLANTCPSFSDAVRGSIPIERGSSLAVYDLCIEPKEFLVKEESSNKRKAAEYITGKVVTRDTSTLEQITGTITSSADGKLTFVEEDGIDFQAITVQLPGGELVPMLFTIKGLVAESLSSSDTVSTATDFRGDYKVPSYRGAAFLDPKGRGVTSGYDNAVALPSSADDDELNRANTKRFEAGKGSIALQITKIDGETGEIGGVFESEQPSDTDLGAKEALDLKIRGTFYARLEPKV
jgi:photosystem II oxygen-evolving enhancer protein 1